MEMLNTKRSITFKVLAAYLLLAALAAVSVWFVYSQWESYTQLNQSNSSNNDKLFLVSEITTSLYETENISRRLIQTGNEGELELYRNELDSIRKDVRILKNSYSDSLMQSELDSISILLNRKTSNLEELFKLREQDRNTNYYSQVLEELRKVNESFDPNYDERFANLEPHQRRVLIRLLEYSREDNAQQITNQTADSIIGSVKNVLAELEAANRRFRQTVNEKENELLENDVILNQQLRKLLTSIEQEERISSLERAEASEQMLSDSYLIIIIAGSISFFIILIFIILIIQDVSRSHRYRLQLEEAKVFAESLLKSREQFMATITHDLRSPLNTLIGYTDLLKKSGLNNKQSHYLSQLKKSSDFILHLVNDLLDLSKLEAGKMLIEKLPFNAKNLIEDSVYNSLPANSDKPVNVWVDADEDTSVQVLSDPFRIKQIITNLVTNAWKFTEEGEIKVSVHLKKEIEDSYSLYIKVKDTGIGISEAKQETIFEEFSQENSSIERNYGGTGLGLSITRRLTKLLKGDIKLQSEAGKGSEFTVCIPVVKLPATASYELEPEIPENRPNLDGKRALVVDDENSQLALTQELVKSLGLSCARANNGNQAMEILKTEKIDLVLTDIQMPGSDGFDLIKNIRENSKLKHIPAIALSGRTDVDEEVYRRAGFQKSLLKPYKPAALLNSIEEIFKLKIDRKERPQFSSEVNNGFSLEEIHEFSGGDAGAMQVIIKAFLHSSEANLEDLKMAHAANNVEDMARIAHKMLPMLKQLKAFHITVYLEKLELKQKISEQDWGELIKRIQVLMRQLETEITV